MSPSLGHHRVVLDVTVAARAPAARCPVRAQPGQVLGGQVVQPGQPVGPGTAITPRLRPVDQPDRGRQGALLADRVAVVGGHVRVEPSPDRERAMRSSGATHTSCLRRSARTCRTARRGRRRRGSRAPPPAGRPAGRAGPGPPRRSRRSCGRPGARAARSAASVVGRGAVRQVRVRDEAELFEQLQRAVHGGDVDSGGRRADLRSAPGPGWRARGRRQPPARAGAARSAAGHGRAAPRPGSGSDMPRS